MLDINTAWERMTFDLFSQPGGDSRDGPVAGERLGFHLQLAAGPGRLLTHPMRCVNPIYAAADVLWNLGTTDEISMIKCYSPKYERFANDGVAWGHYGTRLHPVLKQLLATLTDKQDSRQIVLPIFNMQDLKEVRGGTVKDIPCALSVQFLIRKGVLHIQVNMRSNDVWLGFPYDVFFWSCVQHLLAQQLGLKEGTYTHTAGSLHLYERYADRLVFGDRPFPPPPPPHIWTTSTMNITKQITVATNLEADARDDTIDPIQVIKQAVPDLLGHGTLMADIVTCCVFRGLSFDESKDHLSYIYDENLRIAMQQFIMKGKP